MRLLRRLSAFGRLALALVLLGALWAVTVLGIERATDEAEEPRIQDRLLLAKAAARPLQTWLDAGRNESRQVAGSIPSPAAARGAVEAYTRGPRVFGKSVLVVDRRLNVVAASTDRLASVGRRATLCTAVGEDGSVVDPVFPALVETAAGTVSAVFSVPGTCAVGLAAAAPASSGLVAFVFADVAEVRARLAEATAVVPDLSVLIVLPDGTTLGAGQELPATARPGVSALVADRSRSVAAKHSSGDAEYVGAFQPVGDGWGVLVDQPAADFDVSPTDRPAVQSAAVLTAVFALAFAVVAWFDIRSRRAARRADEHRQAFLSIVGHELRTPLTVIKGYTDTLAARWDALDDRSRQMLVESMAPQTQRQARVIEHLLTAASLQAGSYAKPAVGPTELAPVIDQVVEEFRVLSPLHEFDVEVQHGAEGVQGDSTTLVQVLGELVDNAVKYAPSGGTVRITAARHGRHVEIAVDDEGVGLPSDVARLFDPFTQAEAVDQRVHAEGGVGVGLYITRTLLSMLGGQVRAERRPDGGSRFVVRLDRARVVTPADAKRGVIAP